jgi:hypothetical protein
MTFIILPEQTGFYNGFLLRSFHVVEENILLSTVHRPNGDGGYGLPPLPPPPAALRVHHGPRDPRVQREAPRHQPDQNVPERDHGYHRRGHGQHPDHRLRVLQTEQSETLNCSLPANDMGGRERVIPLATLLAQSTTA